MKKKRRTLLVLALSLCVLAGAYAAVVLLGNRPANPGAADDKKIIIYTCESISDISYSYGGENLHFIWSDADSKWNYEQDATFPLKQSTLSAMVRTVKEFTVERIVRNDTDNLSDYGLDKPVYSFAAVTGTGEKVSFQIGAQNTQTGNYYLRMDGKNAIYLFDGTTAERFMKTLSDLITLDTLPKAEGSAVHEFRFAGPDGKDLDFVRLEDGSDTYYTANQKWFLKAADGSLTPVNDIRLSAIVAEIVGTSFQSALTYNPTEAELSALGLADPDYTITIHYTATYEEKSTDTATFAASGESAPPKTYTKEESFTLYLGRASGDGLICARLGDSKVIGLLDSSKLSVTLKTDPANLYVSDVCQLSLNEIRSMNVKWNGATYQIGVTAEETTAADGTKTTTLSYTLNGAPVASDAVEKLFSSITALKAESTAASDPGSAPDVTITFVRDRSPFGTMTMELAPYDTNFYLVRFAGDDSLLVNRRLVQTLTGLLDGLQS